MTDGDKEDKNLYTRLLLGLLPFDVDTVIEILQNLSAKANKTSWPQLFRRSANFGLFLSTIGIVAVVGLFLTEISYADFANQEVGIVYAIGTATVFVMFLANFLLQLLQNVNRANAVFPKSDERLWAGLLEFSLGAVLVALITSFLITIGNKDIYLVFGGGMALTGLFLAGVSLTLSGTINVVEMSSNPDNRTLDEFDDE